MLIFILIQLSKMHVAGRVNVHPNVLKKNSQILNSEKILRLCTIALNEIKKSILISKTNLNETYFK